MKIFVDDAALEGQTGDFFRLVAEQVKGGAIHRLNDVFRAQRHHAVGDMIQNAAHVSIRRDKPDVMMFPKTIFRRRRRRRGVAGSRRIVIRGKCHISVAIILSYLTISVFRALRNCFRRRRRCR